MIIELRDIHVEEAVYISTGGCPIGPFATTGSDSQARRMEDVIVTT